MTANPGWVNGHGQSTGVKPPSTLLGSWRSQPPVRVFDPTHPPTWWWLGVGQDPPTGHVAEMFGAGQSAYESWPDPAYGASGLVTVVCWSTVRGIEAALDASRQHAAGYVPAGVGLLGVVVVGVPGKVARPVRERLRQLEFAYPNTWLIAWQNIWTVEPFRQRLSCPPDAAVAASELETVAEARLTFGPQLTKERIHR